LPIGYADGWIRMLQGQEVLLEGERSPLVGRICMDQCMVKLSRDFPVGTEVTLIGKNATECITVDDIAEKLKTINYEVTCMISSRVPRVYLQEGRVTGVSNQLI
jgi:alanine racemase